MPRLNPIYTPTADEQRRDFLMELAKYPADAQGECDYCHRGPRHLWNDEGPENLQTCLPCIRKMLTRVVARLQPSAVIVLWP